MSQKPENAHDSYLRVAISGVSHILRSPSRRSLTFVDVDLSDLTVVHDVTDPLKHIRMAPELFDETTQAVVVRWPLLANDDSSLDLFVERAQEWVLRLANRELPVAILIHAAGVQSRLLWGPADHDDPLFPNDDEIMQRCRQTEMYALLSDGGAIWSPLNHHYRLPSGAHAGSFVRLADAARTPPDSYCVASWLQYMLTPGLAVILDSSTLMPVALALQLAASRNSMPIPRVEVVQSYHQTSFDIKELMVPADRVLVVQSVSSTGSLTERLGSALDRSGLPGEIHVLVDRQFPTRLQGTPPAIHGAIHRWLGLEALDEVYASQSLCRLCTDPRRSRYLQIDSKSFDALILPRPRLVTPSIRAARHNRTLWELATEHSAIGWLTKPSDETVERRPPFLDVRFYMSNLFSNSTDPALQAALRARVLSNSRRIKDRGVHRTSLVLAWEPSTDEWSIGAEPDRDAAREAARATIRCIFSSINEQTPATTEVKIPDLIFVDRSNPSLSAADQAKLMAATDIAIFDWSTITGHTLRALLSTVRGWARRSSSQPRIRGIVVHARPESMRSFSDLQDAFDQDLLALWLTFMPMSRPSPFKRERALLSNLQQALNQGAIPDLAENVVDDVRGFIRERFEVLGQADGSDWRSRSAVFRREVTNHNLVNPYAVLWGMPMRVGPEGDPETARDRHSRAIFGTRLDSVALFAASANAVQTVRDEASSGMDWQQFDLPGTVDAFQDPVAMAAFLRWLGPDETWWGEDPATARRVIADLIHRAIQKGEQAVVVAELLLAVAQGKVPDDAAHIPVEHARGMIQEEGTAPHERMALQTGLVLAQSEVAAWTADRDVVVARLKTINHELRKIGFPLDEAADLLSRSE